MVVGTNVVSQPHNKPNGIVALGEYFQSEDIVFMLSIIMNDTNFLSIIDIDTRANMISCERTSKSGVSLKCSLKMSNYGWKTDQSKKLKPWSEPQI